MKLKSQTTSTLSSSCSNQDSVTTQMNRNLADIRENDTRNPLASWKERQTSYSKIAPLQRIFCRLQPHRPVWKDFFLCGILTDGRRNRMIKSLKMGVFLKLNKDILYVHVVTLKYFLVFTALKLIIIWKTKIRSKIN